MQLDMAKWLPEQKKLNVQALSDELDKSNS
jgi:hypothetical protein